MMDLYSWTTPNGRKISIAMDEMGFDYNAHAIDITKDEQFASSFLAMNPNHKIPVLKDNDTVINESGAILLYLAKKSGLFLPKEDTAEYWKVMEWLMWQMSGLGPMLGQAHHFLHYNTGKSAYSEKRYHNEAIRLYGVLDKHLQNSDYLVGELSIADFAIWPWVSRFDYQRIDLNDFKAVREWYVRLASRPAFISGYAKPLDVNPIPMPN